MPVGLNDQSKLSKLVTSLDMIFNEWVGNSLRYVTYIDFDELESVKVLIKAYTPNEALEEEGMYRTLFNRLEQTSREGILHPDNYLTWIQNVENTFKESSAGLRLRVAKARSKAPFTEEQKKGLLFRLFGNDRRIIH